MTFWQTIKADFDALLAKIESEASNAWAFLKLYVQEAINEEEAALFPIIEQQAMQILQDQEQMNGLSLKDRIALAESEIMSDLTADGKVAAATLVNAYLWVVAHKLGLTDGNQGQSSTSNFS